MYVLAKASYYLFMSVHAFTSAAEIGQYDLGPYYTYHISKTILDLDPDLCQTRLLQFFTNRTPRNSDQSPSAHPKLCRMYCQSTAPS